jgi:surfactin synthase thioesterase subunit
MDAILPWKLIRGRQGMEGNRWLVGTHRQGGNARFRMFCLPYAGGGASVYRNWESALRPAAEVLAVQLPGREERFMEPRYYSIVRLVDALMEAEDGEGWFDPPHVLFGHSMGAKIAFETARRLEGQGRPPALLIVSGSRPVNTPVSRRISDLPDALFNEELRRLAGTPEEILKEEEFMLIYRTILRADFAMDETYFSDTVLNVPITAFAGVEDSEVSAADIAGWKSLTTAGFSSRMTEGDHFFLKKHEERFLGLIRQELVTLAENSDAAASRGWR